MIDNSHKKGCSCRINTKHQKPKKIIFECDRDPQEAVFEILEPVDSNPQILVENFPLTNILIDARNIFRPIVFIEFSSLIFFKAIPETSETAPQTASLFRIRLKFILTRKCDNGPEETIRTWEYEKSITLDEQELNNIIDERTISVPFSVVHCEYLIRCDCDCCEYAVKVTATSTSEPIFDNSDNVATRSDFINIEEARVTKTSMSGFAQAECGDCCRVREC